MIDVARNFAFSICIVAGLCTMLWGTAWILSQAVEEWLKWRNLKRLFLTWVREQHGADRAARREKARNALMSQAHQRPATEDEIDVD
jgi:hypothetical protein